MFSPACGIKIRLLARGGGDRSAFPERSRVQDTRTRRELKKMTASRTMKAGEVRRAKVILQLAAGQSYRTISKQQGCGQDFVARWKARFVKERLAGLYARHRGKIVSEKIIGQEARTLKATKEAAGFSLGSINRRASR